MSELFAKVKELLPFGFTTAATVGLAILWWKKRRTGKDVGVVSGLFVFPVKSCGGIPLAEAECVSTGVKYDRYRYLL